MIYHTCTNTGITGAEIGAGNRSLSGTKHALSGIFAYHVGQTVRHKTTEICDINVLSYLMSGT